MCSYRRVGIKDLVEQVHRAFWEELSRYVAGQVAKVPEEDESHSRTRKSLYRNIAIMCQSLLQARSRPVIDIISEFAGLKFNDNPPFKQPHPQERSDSGENSEYETENDSHDDNLSCTCEGVFIEDLDPYGFDNEGLESDDIDPFLDTLDYSDDEVMLDSMNDLETPIDDAFFISPIITAASLSKEQDEELISEGRDLFKFFASELFHHRLVLGYLQKATFDRQTRLLMEEEESEKLTKEREVSKQQAKKRKKERQKLLKQQKQEPEQPQAEQNLEQNNSTENLSFDETEGEEDQKVIFHDDFDAALQDNSDAESLNDLQTNEVPTMIGESPIKVIVSPEDVHRMSLSQASAINSLAVSDIEEELLKNRITIDCDEGNSREISYKEPIVQSDRSEFSKVISCNELENEVIGGFVKEIEEDEINNLFQRLEQELKLLQSFVDSETTPPGFELNKMLPPVNEIVSSTFIPTFWWQDNNSK